ncbi:IclR family transcriptional regulator [Kribbella italica]|uniref:DNA-binding IclR family transcriptional regulator n=1 Tax=Kribbella italica TaxID=1540520 RepID=A0A7W9MTE8_9ACTN|nr:IclR family transcriptional regulator [Kribbella italica]MBB5834843.1 DNA-binding IclR family transcriptional regulator [Kribbella italica]
MTAYGEPNAQAAAAERGGSGRVGDAGVGGERELAGVRSVHRALDLLERFDDEHPTWTLAELTTASKLPKTTVLRLVTTLEQRGLVAAIGPGRYAIGPGFLRWSRLSSASMEIPPAVRSAMGKLAADTGETANLYIRVGRTRVCLAQAQGTLSVRHSIAVGSALPLWGGAASKVLLSDPPVLETDPSVIDDVAGESPYGSDFPKKLRAIAAATGERGFAITHGERELGASGVSAPVLRSDGRVVAAVGVGGPTTRFNEERLPAYVQAVRRCARTISSTGWSGFSAS